MKVFMRVITISNNLVWAFIADRHFVMAANNLGF